MSDKESVLGKSEIVNALIEEGFNESEADRAYEIMLDELERGLRAGRTLHFRRLFKVWPERMPPRRWWDNWHKRHIYFGERIMLKVKPFYLKDRNMPAEDAVTITAAEEVTVTVLEPTGRKMRAGRRSKIENELLKDNAHLHANNLPRKETA